MGGKEEAQGQVSRGCAGCVCVGGRLSYKREGWGGMSSVMSRRAGVREKSSPETCRGELERCSVQRGHIRVREKLVPRGHAGTRERPEV